MDMDKVKDVMGQVVDREGKNNRKPIMKGRWLGRKKLGPMRAIYGCPPYEGKRAKHL